MAKSYRVRTGARAAPKVQEKALIKRARKLMHHPEFIVPRCDGDCRRCPFKRAQKHIDRVYEAREDEEKLKVYARRGDHLARAYAGTLQLAHQGKAPYLAAIKLPTGDVSYAVRGKAKRNYLIGVQNYHDPMLRLFAVMDTARKKKIHIYSLDDEMVCTGSKPNPPAEFVTHSIKELKPDLKKAGPIYHCPHLSADDVDPDTTGGVSAPHLRINWRSPGVSIGICDRCARSSKQHSLSVLASRIAAKDPLDDFSVNVSSMPTCKVPDEECLISDPPAIPKEMIDEYLDTKITDTELIEQYQTMLREEFFTSRPVIILNNACYGTNWKRAVKELKPDAYEARALKILFKHQDDAIIIDKATPNKILQAYWDEFGEEMVRSVVGDTAFAEEYVKDVNIGKKKPSEVLKEARKAFKHERVLDALPAYDELPPIAAFADEVARVYKTKGADETVRRIGRYKGSDTKIKSVAFAFLLTLGKGTAKRWQYAKTETDFAKFLNKYAERLLKAGPDDYHDALQKLLNATGSTEEIAPA